MHNLLPEDYSIHYITLLRAPWQRFLSEFRFLRSRFSPVTNLKDFVEIHHANFMTDWLGNGSVDKAIETLTNKYSLFGTVERFDDFISILSEKAEINIDGYTKANQTASDLSSLPPDNELKQLKQRFRKTNADDLELYKWVEHVFDIQFRDFIESGGTQLSIQTEKAVNPRPKPDLQSSEIRTLIDSDQTKKAVELLEKNRNEMTPPHCVYLAENYLNINKPEKAEKWLKIATEMDSDMVFDLARYYLATNRPFDAIRILETAMEPYDKYRATDSYAGNFARRVKDVLIECREVAAKEIEKQFQSAWRNLAGNNETAKVAIYGAGAHTEWLETIFTDMPGPEIAAIIDDNPDKTRKFWKLKPVLPSECDASEINTVLISSDTLAKQMEEKARKLFAGNTDIVNIYSNIPNGPYPKQKRNRK